MEKQKKYTTFLLPYRDIILNSKTHFYSKKGKDLDIIFNGERLMIYSDWLHTIFTWNKPPFPVEIPKEEKNIKIDSGRYAKQFKEGYKEGQLYFVNEFKNDKKETIDSLVAGIKILENKIHDLIDKEILVLNDDIIKKHGYYSGMYFEILEFQKLKPAFFKDLKEPKEDLKTKGRFIKTNKDGDKIWFKNRNNQYLEVKDGGTYKISYRIISLVDHYSRSFIKDKISTYNKDEKASEYGWESPSSGTGLNQTVIDIDDILKVLRRKKDNNKKNSIFKYSSKKMLELVEDVKRAEDLIKVKYPDNDKEILKIIDLDLGLMDDIIARLQNNDNPSSY